MEFLTEAEEAADEDFPQLWREASGVPDERLRRVLLDRLAARWAQFNPEAAFEWLLANEVPEGEILTFFLRWAEIDPDAAMSAAGEHPGLNAGYKILKMLATRRPGDFLRLVSIHNDVLQGYALQLAKADAWHALTLADPAAALQRLADTTEDAKQRIAAAKAIGSALARSSGFGALGTISGITDKGLRRSALHSALDILADVDPVNASREFREHRGSMDRKVAMFALIRGLSQHSPGSLLEVLRADGWVGETRGRGRYFDYNDASSISGGPAALHAFLVLGGDPQHADDLVERNRGSMATQAAFANSLFAIPKDPSRDLLIQETFAHWSSDDLTGAREFAEGIEDPDLRNQALDGLLTSIHSERLGAQAREIVAGIEGHILSRGALDGLTRADPGLAVEYLTTIPEDDRFQATMQVFSEMGDVDGEIGGRLLENCTDPEVCRSGARWLMENWLDNDPRAASIWAAGLDEGPTLQGAADRISSYHHGTAEGFAWGTVIQDPVVRAERLAGAATRWAKKDPQAALEGITGSDRITESERATLLELISQP